MGDPARNLLERLFRAGLAAVRTDAAVRRAVRVEAGVLHAAGVRVELDRCRRVTVVGAGKGTGPMAAALERQLGGRIDAGLIAVKRGHDVPLQRIGCVEAGHPLPDRAGAEAAIRTLGLVSGSTPDDLVLVCLSGGASALWTCPPAGIDLDDLRTVNGLLLGCGASIDEFNTVRKHLSRISGGRLAAAAFPARTLSLIVSDVPGDDLAVIGSGPTVADPSSFGQALSVLARHGLLGRLPPAVRSHLEGGSAGRVPETPKPGDPRLARTATTIVATNRDALAAIRIEAERSGLPCIVRDGAFAGEAREIGRTVVERARAEIIRREGPVVLAAGGETTVTLRGNGSGGRNQEMALAAAMAIRPGEPIGVLCAGTDGTDGPTEAAGAFVDGTTLVRAAALGLDPGRFLAENDSHSFFTALGDLLVTGPTLTNVMDVCLVAAGWPD